MERERAAVWELLTMSSSQVCALIITLRFMVWLLREKRHDGEAPPPSKKKKMMTLNHPIISSINSLHRLHRLVCPPQEAIYSSVLLTQVCWNIWNVLWPSRSCSRLEGPGQIPLLLGKFSLIARSEPIDLSLLSTEYDKGV